MSSHAAGMRLRAPLVLLAALAGSDAVACSTAEAPRFIVAGYEQDSGPRKPRIDVERVDWQPFPLPLCPRVGTLSLQIRLTSGTGSIEDYGYFVLPVSGVYGSHGFPSYPIAGWPVDADSTPVSLAWSNLPPDTDGHYRWKLLLIPVAANGTVGVSRTICLSTDDSCED